MLYIYIYKNIFSNRNNFALEIEAILLWHLTNSPFINSETTNEKLGVDEAATPHPRRNKSRISLSGASIHKPDPALYTRNLSKPTGHTWNIFLYIYRNNFLKLIFKTNDTYVHTYIFSVWETLIFFAGKVLSNKYKIKGFGWGNWRTKKSYLEDIKHYIQTLLV